ncbi:FecCD family ABC transporter permease [Amycolatopsis sp. CA-230715]|uniref:FecCD family ABC transporter permease n=1 Tax=Amycolatopsis sp. CA-230715 TaxID=2745196 RepID=UPI001C00C856|nr:iron chelate uptake ABC transporter family permease subunit [Amycolatopsis sp. CA-230715]QWF80625.1 Ferric enterobactin transport system permease protein FepG [Amycolatopsis sp. CA-230715]
MNRRSLFSIAALVLVMLAVGVLSIGTGEFQLSFGDVLKTLAGNGTKAQYLVVTDRLPRALVGVLVGAALGLAGSVFQTLTRNPLGSPDIIGFTTGSATGGVATILVLGGSPVLIAGGALVGGLLTAGVVALFAAPRGLQSSRIVLLGIALSAVLAGINSYLLSRATTDGAGQATVWLVGNLAGRDWGYFAPLAVALLLLTPAVAALSRPLRMLEMGDDTSIGIGVPVQRVRPALFVLSVALVAVATAAAGPIPFVALCAPQLVKRLTRTPGPNLIASMCMGALLVVCADYAGQRLLAASLLPVGVVAAALGGLYLIFFLVTRRRAAWS